MAISFKRYVDIVSGVGGGAGVRQRDLIGRLFTTNPLVPPHSFIEFTTLAEVGDYFGFTSEEYLRAQFYFSFIAKNITAAKKISFARWNDAASAPQIYGAKGDQALATWQAITSGSFSLTLGGVANTMSALNFSAAASLSDVASIIQTAIRTKTGGMWTAATVVWNPVRKSFDFVGGVTGDAAIVVTAGAGGSDIAAQLGWLSAFPLTILAPGSAIETVTQTLTASADASNNFATFLFLKTLTLPEATEAANWTKAQNVRFMFMLRVSTVNASAWSAALLNIGGTAMTLVTSNTEYDEMVPMILLASTDYTKRNSVKNYMFQIFGLTPKVTTDTAATLYDNLKINYYGRTQTAGQFIDFYQRGVLCGLPVDPSDQNVFANEIWLKDYAGSKIMELLLSLERVSANTKGRAQLRTVLQDAIDLALFNGTISVGKPLNTTQKLYVTELTGDELAWLQVQNIGYWLDVVMQSYVAPSGNTEWKAVYTLVYSKDDTVRKVEGSHVLI